MKPYLQRFKEIQSLFVLLLFISFAFSYAMFQGGFVSWFLFYSFLPFAVSALSLSLYSLSDFKAERIFHKRELKAGEKASVTVLIKRKRRFPLLYIIIEDLMDETRKLKRAKKIIFPSFRRKFQVEYSIDELPRGEHYFKKIRIKTGDLLGLVEKEQFILVEDHVLVFPRFEELTYRPIDGQFEQGMKAANERFQSDLSMSVGVREYQPGDRFSWINWKATAKRDQFMTKEFEHRKSHDVMIVMDCKANPNFEAIVAFTASVIRAIARNGTAVGLLTVSDKRMFFPIRGGETQQQQLFYHLAKIQDLSNKPLDHVLEEEVRRQYSTLMLVTADFTKKLIDQHRFFSKGSRVTVFIVKGREEPVSNPEWHRITVARSRGIQVFVIREGNFSEGFSEVSGG
ncbi:DUF58 domain-containing protein [Bacillus sp. B15-48]|uniref:DUF58 domain-containing protein n=1 Tax=Bacillus sp. B15-48 TaxID=1548601 RepID=UPI00193FF25D|nr:DUF58 domain-containing protein [Bacillus sp. B15-48]MBM4765244.1 DUF58 domain-containing protein [Bacillus sp. B15-48]